MDAEAQSYLITSAANESPRRTCTWREDDNGAWQTECGGIWEFVDGRPFENEARYCYRCGREIRRRWRGMIRHYMLDALTRGCYHCRDRANRMTNPCARCRYAAEVCAVVAVREALEEKE